MMQGVFLDLDSMAPADLDFAPLHDTQLQWEFHGSTASEAVVQRAATAEVVITNKVVMDAEIISRLPRLRLIAVAATGTNNIDLKAATDRGIVVSNVRNYATPSVVQHVFALLLNLVTRLSDYQTAVRNGEWQASSQFSLLKYPFREIQGRCLGIVGYGELGRAVATVAEAAFGMKVLIARRPGSLPQPGRLPLHELLPQVDVLSLHTPLTPETRGLIGAVELALMQPHALLLNTARGGIVDEQALVDALRAGKLGGAGIDVLSVEPPRAGNPLLDPELPNLIVTPHIAWGSQESRQRLINELAENIRAFQAGKPRNRVN